jgi:hypothetical protein
VILISMKQHTFANEINVVSESNNSRSSVTVIQTSPGDGKTETQIESGPGRVVVKQQGRNSSAVIIQRTRSQETEK